MNKLLQTYQEDVLALFKHNYRQTITKTTSVNFSDLLSKTLYELGIVQSNKEDTLFLEDWFKKVHLQNFFNFVILESFTEIIFHTHQNAQVLSLDGKKTVELPPISEEDFQMSLEVLALKNNINWTLSEPFASFNLVIHQFTLRATLIHYSTSANKKSKLFLRKIHSDKPTLDFFHLPLETSLLMKELITHKANILISGGTGSGKTTLLRSLLNLIPNDEHLIVLEDTYEILNEHPGQTSFLAIKDQNNKSLKDYCAYSLRMSPDRLIVGEMRSNEVVPFILAMNTGHKGLMSTVHASSGVDALLRISLLFSLFSDNAGLSFNLVTKLVCKNIDYVIHMENKKIVEVIKVIGSEGETPFYERIYGKIHE